MKSPTRRSKAWLIAGGGAALTVAAVIACEVAGWPFLAGPVQQALSRALHRDVLLGSVTAVGESSSPTVRFFGGLKIDVPVLQIGAPAWSRQPYFLRAEGAETRLAYADLWRAYRGAALDIHSLSAEHLIVHAERRADGQASWQFGDPAAASDSTPARMPTVRELRVLHGEMTYVDAPLAADITAQLQLAEGLPAASSSRPLPDAFKGLIASAHGTYGPATVSAHLRTAGATPLLATGADATATPVVLELRAGKAALDFKGTVTDVLHLSDLQGSFRVSGPSLAAVGDPLGVTLPTTGAFVLAGRVAKAGGVWNVLTDDATVGSSKLTAALIFDTRPQVPLLSGRVSGPRLLLADLAPAIGGQPDAPAAPPASAAQSKAEQASRVLPDREFDLPSLRVMNANVLMSFDRVELGQLFALPLQPLRTHLTLQDGKLLLNDVVARTADGNVAGMVSLDGTGKVALWRTELRWNGVKLERWIKQERGGSLPPYVSGQLVGRASLQGQGRSTAQILGSLEGNVTTSLRQGQVSHLAIEAAGIDVAQALGVFLKGDNLLPVSCALADLQAEHGVLRPRALVVDTTDSTVWINGTLSMQTESLDLRAVVSPKDFSPLSLRTPVHVKGTFNAPQVSLEKGPLARKLAGAALLSLINPLAAVIPLIDRGDAPDQADSCAELLERARKSARLSSNEGTATAKRRPTD